MAVPYTVGVLCNPLGGRARKKLDDIRNIAKRLPDATYREASNEKEFQAVLDEFAERKLQLIIIIAGDGTFHAVLGYIFGSKTFETVPVLCPIPAGTTNMTAYDFGISGKPTKLLHSLSSLLSGSSIHKLIERPVLKVSWREGRPMYGMFFGTGLIVEGVKFFKQRVQKTGLTGEGASGIVMLRFLFSLLFDSSAYGEYLSVKINNDEPSTGNYLTVFASALDRLIMGIKPYWGNEEAPIHMTAVRKPATRLWYSIFSLLSGHGKNLREDNGYGSHNLDTLRLKIQGDFIIDGEIYTIEEENDYVQITARNIIKILIP